MNRAQSNHTKLKSDLRIDDNGRRLGVSRSSEQKGAWLHVANRRVLRMY